MLEYFFSWSLVSVHGTSSVVVFLSFRLVSPLSVYKASFNDTVCCVVCVCFFFFFSFLLCREILNCKSHHSFVWYSIHAGLGSEGSVELYGFLPVENLCRHFWLQSKPFERKHAGFLIGCDIQELQVAQVLQMCDKGPARETWQGWEGEMPGFLPFVINHLLE